jgi:perosamine synthetase
MAQNKELIPWFLPRMAGGELQQLAGVLERNFLNDGPITVEFERRIAEIAGVSHAVAVTSGTAAITLALMAKGIGRDDEVIVPDLSFVATANAARLAGAKVVLADVDQHRLTLTVETVEQVISPQTKAIVPVDVNGRGADYRNLEAFCKTRGLVLVCDAAEALGSRYDGRPLGSFGDAACFSFSASKTLTTGQGGMVVTNSATTADRLRELKDQGRRTRGTGGDDLHPVMGYNFKYTDLQAAVGMAQLEVFETRLAKAAQRDAWYRAALEGLDGVQFPDMQSEPGEVRQWTDVLLDKRDAVRAALDAHQIGSRAFWFPIHRQKPYEHDERAFPNASMISDHGLWLPSDFGLQETDVARVAGIIRDVVT